MSTGEDKPDAQLFQLLTHLLHQGAQGVWSKGTDLLTVDEDHQPAGARKRLIYKVETLTNEEEVELRAKIEALGLEVTKVPSKPSQHLDELEIAKELDKLSARLDDVDEMISSAMAADPQVQSLLSSTAELWMPVITATSDERRSFTVAIDDINDEANGRNHSDS